jgi:hypothetical protein
MITAFSGAQSGLCVMIVRCSGAADVSFAEWLPGWNGFGLSVTHEQAARRRTELLDRTLARLG